jgi:predicted hotdog family 3-hydroxylacyl-ACP dehydratase
MITGKMAITEPLQREQFAHLLPHSGDMLLIDEVLSWQAQQITCRCYSHKKTDHPLRLAGKLSALHLIEYGAQAMAVHCGLLTGQAHPGFLAAVRAAHFYIDDLDGVTTDLLIQATAQLQLPNGAVYFLQIHEANGQLLLETYTTVIHL